MEYKTFLNLSEEKQNKVYEATLEEFMRVPFEKVQVKNIVEQCQIPRGSFYKYFENKDGALRFVIQQTRKKNKERIFGDIPMQQINFFEAIKKVFERELNFSRNTYQDTHYLLVQIVKSARAIEIFKEEMLIGLVSDSEISKSWNQLDIGPISVEEQKVISSLFLSILFDAVTALYADVDKVLVKEEFETKLEIIKKGVYATYKKTN